MSNCYWIQVNATCMVYNYYYTVYWGQHYVQWIVPIGWSSMYKAAVQLEYTIFDKTGCMFKHSVRLFWLKRPHHIEVIKVLITLQNMSHCSNSPWSWAVRTFSLSIIIFVVEEPLVSLLTWHTCSLTFKFALLTQYEASDWISTNSSKCSFCGFQKLFGGP